MMQKLRMIRYLFVVFLLFFTHGKIEGLVIAAVVVCAYFLFDLIRKIMSKRALERKLNRVIEMCIEAEKDPNASGWLPHIRTSLEQLKEMVWDRTVTREQRRSRVGGIGRILTDDVRVTDSEVGEAISDVLNDFLKL